MKLVQDQAMSQRNQEHLNKKKMKLKNSLCVKIIDIYICSLYPHSIYLFMKTQKFNHYTN